MFILRRMLEEYHAKGKQLCMCFADLEKAFDRVPWNVLKWAIRKNGHNGHGMAIEGMLS